MTYKDELASIPWQKRRLHILERDKWECRAPGCDKSSTFLNVHHYLYLGDLKPWEYSDDLLITVCDKCHQKEYADNRVKLETHLATTLQSKGFFVSDLLALSCLIETRDQFAKSLLKILRDFQSS